MKYRRILILGGTGFVGTHLATRMTRRNFQITVLTRHDGNRHDLWVLPAVRVVQADVHDAERLAHEMRGHDAVVNLVGILNEKGRDGSGFRRAHVELAEKVIQACREAGVRRLLHMSALGAGRGESHYLRTKGEAERLVLTAGKKDLEVTVFKPSVIFGPGDSFLRRFAGLTRLLPVLPLARPEARFAPVFVGNVADAFIRALEDETAVGRSYELCGPRMYTLRELVTYARDQKGARCLIWGLPDWLARMQARVGELIPGKPFSMDNYRSLKTDTVCSEDGLRELDIRTVGLEAVAPGYIGANSRQHKLGAFRSRREEH